MRVRRMALTMAVLAGGASLATACGSPEGAAAGRGPIMVVPPAPSGSATSGTPATRPAGSATPASGKPTRTPSRTATPRRTSGTTGSNSSAPPDCKLADLTFKLSLGSGGGTGIPGSLLMTNVSGRKCRLSGYLVLTWRDAGGAEIPVSVNRRPDPQTPHAIAIAPGARGIVGMGWEGYRTNPPIVTCTPVPKTLDIRLPPTVATPHPENGPAKRIAWFGGDSGGMCGPKVDMLPVDVAY